MQTHQKSHKVPISLGIIAVIAIAGGVMAIQMYFPDQTGAANPSTGMPIREGSKDYTPSESIVNNQMPVPGNTNPDAIVSDISPSIGMPVPGTDTQEMVVSPQPPQKVN